MTTLDPSEYDDEAFAILSAAVDLADGHRAADRERLREAINAVAGHDRKLHRAMVLFALAHMSAHFARRLAEAESSTPEELLARHRENLVIARLENELDWPEE